MNMVVLDTNVLVSSLLANGPPATIIDLVSEGILTPFYNDHIISEYWHILQRPKFKFHPTQVSHLIGDIMRIGIAVEPNVPNVTPLPDEEDRKFYDVAKSSNAFLITGNRKHFPLEPFIVTPAGFLTLYRR